MNSFDRLLKLADLLLGPEGCPWDRTQTFLTLQPYLLEEVHEVIEAVDANDDQKILEELGDLLYTIVFYGKLAEKEGRFTLNAVIDNIYEKLVRRHPHVFGEQKIEKAEDVIGHWEKIKRKEKAHLDRKSALDGIPPTLPGLARAQKVLKKILRTEASLFTEEKKHQNPHPEKQIGQELIELILRAEESGIDIESALRRTLGYYETEFRKWEMDQD